MCISQLYQTTLVFPRYIHFRICSSAFKHFNHRLPPEPPPFSSPHPFSTLLSPPAYSFLGLIPSPPGRQRAPDVAASLPYHIRLIPKYLTLPYMPHVQLPPSSFPRPAKSPSLLLSSIEIFVALTRCYLSFLSFSTIQFNLPR